MASVVRLLLVLGLTTWEISSAHAQDQAARFQIGYVELAEDPLYDEVRSYFRIPLRPLGRPWPGAELGIADAKQIGSVIGVEFALERTAGVDVEELAGVVEAWAGEGSGFIIADLPAETLLDLADRVESSNVMLLNISAREDRLRGTDCRTNIVHVIPSYAMLADAAVQYVVSRQWRNLLVLQGPLDEDAQFVEAVERAAQRFGARIVETRPFVLTNDPRQREQSNVALMTSGTNYDVAFVADTDGEFARYVPYQTEPPRPVIGSSGLVPQAWHWSWERHGAPQLNLRFEQLAERRMADVDWAAWVAVKGLVQSVMRSESFEYADVRSYLLGERMNLDGFKGNPLSVRRWDQQVRQPVLLATGNAVIARAPLEGFLHQTNELDALGTDEPETACVLRP